MYSHAYKKLLFKRLSYLFFFILFFNAWYVTSVADWSEIYHHAKIVGKGYRRNFINM